MEVQESEKKLDLNALKQDLRSELGMLVDLLFRDFELVTQKKVTADGQKSVDSGMDVGSGGVAFATYKYVQLLKKEKEENPMSGLEASDYERNVKRFESALDYNLKLAENHPLYPNAPATKPADFVDKVSFLKSESVGV